MNKLSKIVSIVCNDEDAVILKVDETKKIEAMSIGVANVETLTVFKKTRYQQEIGFNIVYKDGHHCSFSSNTLISEELAAIKRRLRETVVFDFGIPIEDSLDGFQERQNLFNFIKSVEDDLKTPYIFELSGFGTDDMNIRKKPINQPGYGALMGRMSYIAALDYIKGRYEIVTNDHCKSPNTGCDLFYIGTNPKR